MNESSYSEFTQPYKDARQNLLTRLEVLNKDCRRKYKNYPIHNIQHRIKKSDSIADKLKRLDIPYTEDNAKSNLMDIAGIRVICYFVNDIYSIVDMVKKQLDLVVIKERDYIKNPKPNGYRSYHIVLGVPVYYTDIMEYYPVEVQLRTMSMDFWASMEHRICYKKNVAQKQELSQELFTYAELLKDIEKNFEKHNDYDAPLIS